MSNGFFSFVLWAGFLLPNSYWDSEITFIVICNKTPRCLLAFTFEVRKGLHHATVRSWVSRGPLWTQNKCSEYRQLLCNGWTLGFLFYFLKWLGKQIQRTKPVLLQTLPLGTILLLLHPNLLQGEWEKSVVATVTFIIGKENAEIYPTNLLSKYFHLIHEEDESGIGEPPAITDFFPQKQRFLHSVLLAQELSWPSEGEKRLQ